MQNCPKCVVMETRYMVDTTSQELPIEERRFWSWPTPLYFFSQKMITAQVTLLIFLQTCVFLTVWKVFFFFQTVVGSMWSGLLLLWRIVKLIFLTSMWVVIYPWLTIIITDGHEFKFWLVSIFFFPFHLLFFLLFVFVFFISPFFYCLSYLLNLSNYKRKKMLD